MEMLSKNRLYIVIIAAFAAGLLWFVLLYSPDSGKLKSAEQDIALLEQEINQSRNLIASAGNVAERIEQVDAQLNKYLKGMTALDSIPEFIVMLNERLESFGIRGATVVPKLPDLLNNNNIALGAGRLNKVEFDISGRGRYLELGHFIEALEKEVFYAGSTNLEIAQNQNTNPDIIFDFRFMAYLKGQG